MVVGLRAVDAALKRLHSLSVAIRRSATKRYQQPGVATLHVPHVDDVSEVCYVHYLNHRFPDAIGGVVSHVASSLHARGRSIYYQQRHNLKTRESRRPQALEQPKEEEVTKASTTDNVLTPAIPAVLWPQNGVPVSESNASRIDEEVLRHHVARLSAPSLSHISRGSSIREGQDYEFDYPMKPTAAGPRLLPVYAQYVLNLSDLKV